MRIVSWNMGCAMRRFDRAQDAAWRFVDELAPDVVLVQEAKLDVPRWVEESGLLFLRPAYEGQRWGSGALVRGHRATERVVESAGSFLATVDVHTPAGDMLVVSVHVCPDKKLRAHVERVGAVLAELVADRRFVIAGDFNASRHYDLVYRSKVFSKLLERIEAAGAHDCHFGIHGKEVRTYFGRSLEHYQVDHVFIDRKRASAVTKCEVLALPSGEPLSDHAPLLLELDASI